MRRLKNLTLIDRDLRMNHWLLGGILQIPDPKHHRNWALSLRHMMKKRHPDKSIYYCFVGLMPWVSIVDEQSAEAILRSNQYITKSFVYQFFVPWLGEGMLISTGNKWRSRRKTLTPSFHYRILENFCTSK